MDAVTSEGVVEARTYEPVTSRKPKPQQAPLPYTRSGMFIMMAMGFRSWLKCTTVYVPVGLIGKVALSESSLAKLRKQNRETGW